MFELTKLNVSTATDNGRFGLPPNRSKNRVLTLLRQAVLVAPALAS
jgi:hypothetical protein